MLFLYDTSISSSISCCSRKFSFKLINTLIPGNAYICYYYARSWEKTHPHAFADTEYCIYSVWYEMIECDIVLGPTHHSEVLGSEGLCPPVSTIYPAVQNRAQTSCQVCRFVNLNSQFLLIIGFSFSWFLHFMHA